MGKLRIIPKLLQKSTWTGLGLIAAAVAGYLSKDPTLHLSLTGAFTAVLGGVGLIFADDVTTKPAVDDLNLPMGGGS